MVGYLGALALILVAIYLFTRTNESPDARVPEPAVVDQPGRVGNLTTAKPFAGGTCQVSDVGAVPSKNAVLFIDSQLLLGERRPLINSNALFIPLRLASLGAPITLENLQRAQPNAYQVPLSGQGIRALRFDNHLKSYLIISGSSGSFRDRPARNKAMVFQSGSGMPRIARPNNAGPQKLIQLDGAMRPGGLTRVKIAEREYVFIVGEESEYAKAEYVSEWTSLGASPDRMQAREIQQLAKALQYEETPSA